MNIIGAKFDDKSMDFESLLHSPQFSRTLFIFNDNQLEHNTNKRGAGNAKIRPYNRFSNLPIPKSAGIPTGHYRQGYEFLDRGIKDIDNSFNEIIQLISTGNYDTIMYSVDDYNNAILGRGIFNIGLEVKRYITKRILELGINNYFYFKSSKYGVSNPILITEDIIKTFN